MQNFVLVSFFVLVFSFFNYCQAQPCLDYGEFDGPECVCAPSGWNAITGAEEIDDMNLWAGSCNIPGPSPVGGTAVAFQVSAYISESIETTIDGLEDGQFYYLAFWWISMNCPTFCCNELEIIVDGESTIFPTADEWTLVELCVQAEGETMDLQLIGVYAGGSTIFIDDAGCAPPVEPCCALIVELEEEHLVCPNEAEELLANYSGDFGDVDIEWTCDPSEGLVFLNNLNVINPIFEFDFVGTEFEGTTYTYTVFVTDDECTVSKETTVEILPIVLPTFNFESNEICESQGAYIFPVVSNEGISGVWDVPSIDLSSFAGQDYVNIFTPNGSSVDCPIASEHELEIIELEIPTFEFPLVFCRSQVTIFELPTASVENIEGEWEPASLIASDWADGDIIFTFFPDDQFCTSIIDIEITLESGSPLSFDLPSNFCTDVLEFTFPTESSEEVFGSWEMPTMDFSNLAGLQTNTFIPNDVECYQAYVFDFEVGDAINLTFDTISPICRIGNVIILDSFSLQGIQGTWSIPSFNPDTILENFILSTWSPLTGQSDCISDTALIFYFSEPGFPSFQLPDQLCFNDTLFSFPTVANDGITTGIWSIPGFLPSDIGVGTLESEFTPDDQFCAEPLTWSIEVVQPLEAQFSFDETLCFNDPDFELPIISDNGISGMWTVPIIIPSEINGGEISSIFIADNASDCINDYETLLTISPIQFPEFQLLDYMCWNSPSYILPTSSDNSIEGSWNIDTISIEDISVNLMQLVFTPDDLSCYAIYNHEIIIVSDFEIMVTSTDPSSCKVANGSIALSSLADDLEYSIDNGITWSDQSLFENLSFGNYTIDIRSTEFTDCLQSLSVTLNNPQAPVINLIATSDVSNCTIDDGRIEIDAQGADLEYSIDDGNTWQQSNVFDNLTEGEYMIVVRSKLEPDCSTETTVVINVFPLTQINLVETTNLVDCNSQDGTIRIESDGQNLEYSIDGGLTWSANNVFINLSEGIYSVTVRSMDAIDCLDALTVEILGLVPPTITEITITNSTSCSPNSGGLSVEATGTNLEYSIDGGINWQADNLFDNLSFGTYMVMVREILFPGCLENQVSGIIEIIESLEAPIIGIVDLATCEGNDALINISTSEQNVEFSIDEINWQVDNIFQNLEAGIYNLSMRKIDLPNCFVRLSFEIEPFECPCNDLIVVFETMDISCEDVENGTIEIIDITGQVDNQLLILWDDGSSEMTVAELSEGWHFVWITYDDQCTWKDSAFIQKFDPLTFGLQSFDEACEGSSSGVIEVINAHGGSGSYNYSINGKDYQQENIFYNLTADEYQVFVLDENNCLDSQFVNVLLADQITISLPSIVPVEFGNSIVLNPLINESTIDSFEWSPTIGLEDPNALIAIVNPEMTTDYVLTIYFGMGCIEQRTVRVEVKEDIEIYIPNIFNPFNQNGNDVIYIQASENSNVTINSFNIYDRWGNLVFNKLNPELNLISDGWDGTFNGKVLNPGVFVYMISVEVNGQDDIRTGSITLLR